MNGFVFRCALPAGWQKRRPIGFSVIGRISKKGLSLVGVVIASLGILQGQDVWQWPEGKKAVLSLTFDDARQSQVTQGTALLDKYQAKATFYVVPESMKPVLDGWKEAVANGHEIGNHTLYHPCTGNFTWSRDRALEDYTMARMRAELTATNEQIKELLGVEAESYAYTCGQKFIGRGENTQSYIPLVAELFTSGRGFLDETPNAPEYMDLAQLTGIESDGKDFNEIRTVLEAARETGAWVVLAGHEMSDQGNQTTRLDMLEQLIKYAQDPANGIWLATVREVTSYIQEQRQQQPLSGLKSSLTFHSSYDYGYEADFAKGDPGIYTAPARGKLELAAPGMQADHVAWVKQKGKYGAALEYQKKGDQVLFYKSEQNVAYQRENWDGTISLWLQLDPEHDLEPGYCDPIQITDTDYNDAALWVDFTDKNPRSFRMGVFGDLKVWNPDNIGPNENPDFNNRLVAASNRPFSRDQWTHVVVSYRHLGGEGARADFYINGQLQGTQDNIPEPFTWDLLQSKIFIGLNYVGLIDEVAMFSKSLSGEEVRLLYGLENGVRELY